MKCLAMLVAALSISACGGGGGGGSGGSSGGGPRVAVGVIDDSGSHGRDVTRVISETAPNARLVPRYIPLGDGSGPYTPVNLAGFSTEQDEEGAELFSYMNSRASIVNNSYGFQGVVTRYSAADVTTYMGRSVNAVAQEDRMPSDRTIYVWAAGNAGLISSDRSSPEILPGLPHLIPELRGHYLAVVAVDENGDIRDYSSRCGVAVGFCLAARDNPESGRGGTSFAAPRVSGALARLKAQFPTLGNDEIVTRLLATADDSRCPQAECGQGELDLRAAISAVGIRSLLAGGDLDGARSPVDASYMRLGKAFGDAAVAVAGERIAAFDELDAPFHHRLGTYVTGTRETAADIDLGSRMARELAEDDEDVWDEAGNGIRIAMLRLRPDTHVLRRRANIFAPHFRYVNAPVSGAVEIDREDGFMRFVAAVSEAEGAGGRNGDAAFMAEYSTEPAAADGKLGYAVRAGMLREGSGMLGSRSEGAFGNLDGITWFGGVRGMHNAGVWSLFAEAHAGFTRPRADAGMLRGDGGIVTSSWALGIAGRSVLRAGDFFGVAASQPIRAESGQAALNIAVERTRYREVVMRHIGFGLEPSGRQIDIDLLYSRSVGFGKRIGLGGVYSMEPGHVRNARNDVGAMLTYSIEF